jgi:hypothetical protein
VTLKQLQQSLFFLIRKTLTIFIFMLKDINVDSVKWRLYLSSTTESALISLSFCFCFPFMALNPAGRLHIPPANERIRHGFGQFPPSTLQRKSLSSFMVLNPPHCCFLVKMILLPINSAIHMKRSTDKQKKKWRGGGQRKLEFMVIDLFLNFIYDIKDLP